MSGNKSTGAGDARGLELLDRSRKCRAACQMRAIGTGARHELNTAIEQKCRAFVLHRRCQRLDTIDQAALICVSKAQQNGGYVTGIQCRC